MEEGEVEEEEEEEESSGQFFITFYPNYHVRIMTFTF